MAPRMTAQERRISILQAAVPLFARKGFAATTTKEIARAAHVSEALLYRHFPGKEALYQEIQIFCYSKKSGTIEILAAMEPCTETLVFMTQLLARMVVEGLPKMHPPGIVHQDISRMMVNSFLEDGAFVRTFLAGKAEVWQRVFVQSAEAAAAAGDLAADAPPAALGMWLVYQQAMATTLMNMPAAAVIPYGLDREALLDAVVRFCLRGLGLTEAAVSAHYRPAPSAADLLGL